MAGGPRSSPIRPILALYEGGAAGTLTDSELLDRFLGGRGEAAEAAFEALVVRHGPMVLDVCRNVLGAAHDAEDAFQATFLILACRAGSVRRRDSLASWLFGVASRVARRVRSEAARRRAHERRAAEMTDARPTPSGSPEDAAALVEEVGRLPARYREPVILCYLEGLTYEAAARQLRCPLGTLSVRLKRAKERLRSRLGRRGIADPSAALAAGLAPREAVPAALVASAVRSAVGGSAAAGAASAAVASLTREVSRSMTLRRLNLVAAALASLALGAGLWAWRGSAAADEPGPDEPASARDRGRPAPPREEDAPGGLRMVGSVRDEATGEPVPGATFDVMLGDSGREHRGESRAVRSGEDGRFSVDLPPGNARAWTLRPPVGYWAPRSTAGVESFAVSEGSPVFRKDYLVRRGTVWGFRIARAGEPAPIAGGVMAFNEEAFFFGERGDSGRVRLTLPTEAGRITAGAGEAPLATDPVRVTLEWESGFRPDAARSISELGGQPARYRLTDEAGKTATISRGGERGRVEPVLEGGGLVIRVTLPEAGRGPLGELAGKVVDATGGPIEGARVALIQIWEGGGSAMSADERHTATTDAEGGFRLLAIPRERPDGGPPTVQLAVTKDGYAGVDTRPIAFEPPSADEPQVVEAVTLAPGVSVSGTVVDPEGKPLAGAWVEPGGSYASRSRFTKTDERGRFTVRDLPEGMVPLSFSYGDLTAGGKYLAQRDTDPLAITLRPSPDPARLRARAEAARAARPRPIAVGAPAPEWEAGDWSDGRARTLADYRGRVVVLDFWGIWCGPCLHALPTLETLRSEYEPRGVAFLSLHTPGETEKNVRKILEMKEASLVFALDRAREEGDGTLNGVTAERYGVGGYPTIVIVDREGKVAFNTGDPGNMPAVQALVEEMGLDPKTMNEDQASRLMERLLARAIDGVLGPDAR